MKGLAVETDFDVAVVGYGPVGMVMAALLGRYGHRVVVLERYSGKYNLPRAAIFDDETMRTFALLGISERMLAKVHVQHNYEWRNGQGDLLIEHEFAAVGRSGWAEWYMMYQPDLEDALDDVCRSLPNVEVRYNSRVMGVEQDPDGVRLTVEGRPAVTARYAIACDGGNSTIRQLLDIPLEDFGFSEPWMVCDFRFTRDATLPTARQVCDPVQPISIISLGPDHHRFSFAMGSEESFEHERQPDLVWQRVSAYLSRDDAELIRAATYTFRSLVAARWRVARIVLAGDSAHQMPPFLGQGMCSGIRDALNLAFKIDLILRGVQKDALLDTYQSERDEHVRAVIAKGIELGRVQTLRDPAAATVRDARLLALRAQHTDPERFVFPPLGPGFWGTGDGSRDLILQAQVGSAAGSGRFDEVFGYGFVVLMRATLSDQLDSDAAEACREAGVRVVFISANDVGGSTEETGRLVARDVDGSYLAWLDEHHCDAVAVRPDFHVWGTAAGPQQCAALVGEVINLLGGGDAHVGRVLDFADQS